MSTGAPPAIDAELVVQLAGRATGRADPEVGSWSIGALGHPVANLTTCRIDLLQGELADGSPWACVAKALHPASCSPGWAAIPEAFHQQVLEDLDWRDEPRAYRGALRHRLPTGLRMPEVLHVEEGPDRIVLWLEHVADTTAWDVERYHRTARLLGQLAAGSPEHDGAGLELGRRPLGRLFFGKVTHFDLAVMADDAFWADPAIRAATAVEAHRAALARLAAVAPAVLERQELEAHLLAHGDATPDNFLEPGDGTVVGIDWSYASFAPAGADLGQLLAGRIESGAMGEGDLPEVAEASFAGYLAGVADVDGDVDAAAVRRTWATHLAVRSAFSALIVDHRPDLGEDERCALVARRAALARFAFDLVDDAFPDL